MAGRQAASLFEACLCKALLGRAAAEAAAAAARRLAIVPPVLEVHTRQLQLAAHLLRRAAPQLGRQLDSFGGGAAAAASAATAAHVGVARAVCCAAATDGHLAAHDADAHVQQRSAAQQQPRARQLTRVAASLTRESGERGCGALV